MLTNSQILARVDHLNNFKKFVIDNPNTPLDSAISQFYGEEIDRATYDMRSSLIRIAETARKFPHRVTR